MATEQTPKKVRVRPAKVKDEDIAAYKSRISSLASKLEESNRHKRKWISKCNELWAEKDSSRVLIAKLEELVEKLNEKVERHDNEIKDKEITYKRLVAISQSLCNSLYSASDALKNISGGF